MKVVYELEAPDIIKILAEKYGVKAEKIKMPKIDFAILARIDMSDTETPEEHPKRQINTKCEFSTPEASEKAKRNNTKANSHESEERYRQLTDENLKAYLESGGTVVQLCEDLGLEIRHKYRLYKRAEKLRSEGACNPK